VIGHIAVGTAEQAASGITGLAKLVVVALPWQQKTAFFERLDARKHLSVRRYEKKKRKEKNNNNGNILRVIFEFADVKKRKGRDVPSLVAFLEMWALIVHLKEEARRCFAALLIEDLT